MANDFITPAEMARRADDAAERAAKVLGLSPKLTAQLIANNRARLGLPERKEK